MLHWPRNVRYAINNIDQDLIQDTSSTRDDSTDVPDDDDKDIVAGQDESKIQAVPENKIEPAQRHIFTPEDGDQVHFGMFTGNFFAFLKKK